MKPGPTAGPTVPVVQLDHAKDFPLPSYATADSAGLDLMAAVEDDLVLEPGARALVPTGLAVALPKGHEAQIRPRSGLAIEHGVTTLNGPGTIDADYRGEIKVILINHGQEPFTVTRRSRIAQMVIAPYARVAWEPREHLDETGRGPGGFGSTGLASRGEGAEIPKAE